MIKTVYDGFNPSGPNIAILAGIHGNEITPVYTLMKMIKDGSLTDLTIFDKINKITIANNINKEGLENNRRDFDTERTSDLNRIFDDEDPINISELKDLLTESDIVIDIHSSPNCTEFALIDINENTNSLVNWCNISNVNYACRYSTAKTIKRFVQNIGNKSITLEINGISFIDFKSADKTIKIIKSLLDNLFNFEYKEELPTIKELINIFTYKDGIPLHTVNLGDIINEGDIISNINNSRGDIILEIKSPVKGRIISLSTTYVAVGGLIALIQPL